MTDSKILERLRRYTEIYKRKTGTQFSTVPGVTEAVIKGLAQNMAELGRPLCPCNFYADKKSEIKHRRWLCPCDEMQIYKYCHCLLYVAANDLPITEYLPEAHEGRAMYGLNPDPHPEIKPNPCHRSAASIEEWHRQ
ncbi:MAG: ferredoxin-thioredoxin reductase catalytic domain-containing protein [Candidatus Bruticola sp.]